MAVTTIVPGVNGNVYRNAIQPVGEVIYLNFVRETLTLVSGVSQTWFYDFDLDDNYAVTGLEAVKTITPIVRTSNADSQNLNVFLWRLGAGTDAATTQTQIGELCFSGGNPIVTIGANTTIMTGQVGSRVKAGRIDIGYDPGAAAAPILGPITTIGGDAANPPTRLTNLFRSGIAADPMVRILAVAPTAVGTVTKQRLRIAISTIKTGNVALTYSASCFVKVELARFNDNALSEIITHTPTGFGTVGTIV
jgi:hypothetical protein